jgi:hypothetical protein
MRRPSLGFLIVLTAIASLCVYALFHPISRVVSTPFTQRFSMMSQLSSKLFYYTEEHTAFPDGSMVNSNLNDLVKYGVLLQGDADYIATNHIQYHGWNLGQTNGAAVLFDCAFPLSDSPHCHIFAFTDGHAEAKGFHKP